MPSGVCQGSAGSPAGAAAAVANAIEVKSGIALMSCLRGVLLHSPRADPTLARPCHERGVMNQVLPPNLASGEAGTDPDEFHSLPGWLYHDAEFFAYEADRVLRPSWQVVCHVN